jgi:hypothetical protein
MFELLLISMFVCTCFILNYFVHNVVSIHKLLSKWFDLKLVIFKILHTISPSFWKERDFALLRKSKNDDKDNNWYLQFFLVSHLTKEEFIFECYNGSWNVCSNMCH